jgi:hypothetical protein
MSAFITPRHDTCASCEIRLTGWPLYRGDEAFCCPGCADGGPCVCTYESDLADDGVNRLGLPFAVPAAVPQTAAAPAPTPERVGVPLTLTSSGVAVRS